MLLQKSIFYFFNGMLIFLYDKDDDFQNYKIIIINGYFQFPQDELIPEIINLIKHLFDKNH